MSGSWTSNLLSFVTGSRKRRAQEDGEEGSEPAIAKRCRADPKLNESVPPAVPSFSYRAPNKNITLNDSILSIPDSFSSKPPVFDLRHKIKTPSRTKSILAELTKYSSSPNSAKNNLHLFENSRWIDSSSRNSSALPPRRSTFTPSRIQQISANMNRTLKANKSAWNSSLTTDPVANGSRLATFTNHIASTEPDVNQAVEVGETSIELKDNSKPMEIEITKLSNGPTTNKFGLTDLDDIDEDDVELVFTFDPPEVRGPRRLSVSPSPTESSSKSDPKKNSSDSESSSNSAESDDSEIGETKKLEGREQSLLSSSIEKETEICKRPENWICKNCLNKNDIDLQQCKGCEYGRDGKKVELKITGGITVGRLGSQWECPDCMVRNKPDSMQCVCCAASKPGSNGPAPASAPKSTVTAFKPTKFHADSTSLGLFGMGGGTTLDSPAVSFGVPAPQGVTATTLSIPPFKESASSVASPSLGLLNSFTTTSTLTTSSVSTTSSSTIFGSGVATTATSVFGTKTSTPLFDSVKSIGKPPNNAFEPESKKPAFGVGATLFSSPSPTVSLGSLTSSSSAVSTTLSSSSVSSILASAPKFSNSLAPTTSSPFAFASADPNAPAKNLFGVTTEGTPNAPSISLGNAPLGTSLFNLGPKTTASSSDPFGKSSGSFLFGGQNGTPATAQVSASSSVVPDSSVSASANSATASGFDFGASSLNSGFNFGRAAPKIGEESSAGTAPFAFGTDVPGSTNGSIGGVGGSPFVFGGNPNSASGANANLFSAPTPSGNVFSAGPSGGLSTGRKILAARRRR